MSTSSLKGRLTPVTLAAMVSFLTLGSLQAQTPAPGAAGVVVKTNFSAQLTILAGQQTGSVTLYTVLTGKRLVVEYVSSLVTLSMGDRIASAMVNEAVLAPAYVYDSGFKSFTTISQPLKYYVNAGESLVFTVGRFYTAAPVSFPVTVTGYIEDAP